MVQVRASHGLLGGHVVDRSQHPLLLAGRLALLGVGAGQPGHAQVEDLDHALRIDEQIGGLDIAVYQLAAVGVLQSFGRLADVIGRAAVVQWAVGLDHPPKVPALDQLQDQIVAVAFLVQVISMDDVGVVQRGDRPGLDEESLQNGQVAAELLGDDLQSHAAIHRRVLGNVDASPAAAAQEIQQLVLADGKHAGPGQQLFRLPAGQEILLHQAAEERFGIVALIGGLASLGELLGREQMALLQ